MMQDAFAHTRDRAPRDAALPGLVGALDPARAGAWLEGVIGDHGTPTVRVLKHVHGKRCVLAYEFADGSRVVGKMYRKDRAGRHAAILRAMNVALDGDTRVPKLLGCWDDLGMILEAWVPGAPVRGWDDVRDTPGLAERLGHALATLHATHVPAARRADLEAQVRRTCHPGIEALAAAQPEEGPRLQALMAAIFARDAQVAPSLVTSHGDFAPTQLFVDADTVYLLDLDGLCIADRALDLANFRVGLEVHLGDAGRGLGDRFLAAYTAHSGAAPSPALPHYEAFCHVRRAMILWRKQPAGWRQELALCLGRGAARL
jgi:aminoglycoside phosphotransferase